MIDAMAWAARRSTDSRRVSSSTAWRLDALFVDEQRTLLDEVHDATVVVVEPDRVSSRLADLLDEERELTDAVAATWQATSQIPLLHADWSRVSKTYRRRVGRVARRTTGSLNLTSPPIVQGDAARIAGTFVGGRRNVEGGAHVERRGRRAHGRQLRGEGLESRPTPPGCSTCASACSRARWRRLQHR